MASRWSAVVIFCILNCNLFVVGQRDENTLLGRLAKNTELTEFYGMLERNAMLNVTLGSFPATIFAPTNEAFQKFRNGEKDDTLLLYHIVLTPYTVEQLPNVLAPNLVLGSRQLKITRTNNNVYVNNAKIILGQSVVINKPDESKRKVLHIIDEVLQPLRLIRNDPVRENPNAWGLLESSHEYKIPYQIGVFANRIRLNKKEDVFRDQGPNTYLIPIDDEFSKNRRSDLIDDKVIDAHVIPRTVLFLKPTAPYKIFESIAFTDFIKVLVSFPDDITPFSEKRYAKSNTVIGDQKHPAGVVLSEIVAGNIPVQNGVVHLIRTPLTIIDKTVEQFVKEDLPGPFSAFKDKLRYAGDVFRSKLSSQQGITLFVPSDAAWKDPNVVRAIHNNTNLLENLLNLHMVSEKLPLSTIRERGIKEVSTLYKKKYLYFNVIIQGTNHTLTVEGGGVNATAIYADIAATNGVIHVIDRVLGIPYATVGRKVATDPSLNMTYTLGRYQNFNNKLDDINQNYTYFVPRDAAWQLFSVQHPTLYKALTKPEFAYEVLEHHLVVSGNFSMSDLKKIANETYVLPTARSGLSIRVREDSSKGYVIEWNNEAVPVYRADVRCTNGIIHVIDRVMITQNDVSVQINSAVQHRFSMQVHLLITMLLGFVVFYH